MTLEILTIETASLGDRSYVVHDGTAAAVIDPQRDIDRIMALVEKHGVAIEAVFETHVHNDYVTGGYELSRRTDARYYLNAQEHLAFEFTPVGDGDEVKVGTFVVRALHTPGHTPTHMSYVVGDGTNDVAVFTGGSLLYGSVGRTDLVAAERTEELTRLQHRSARRLVADLAAEVQVLPTHGFGSFCSSGQTTGASGSTIAAEQQSNQALAIDDEAEFVRTLIAGLDDYPAYYAHMGPLNRSGPTDVDLSPAILVDTTELLRRIDAGEWVVDLRSRSAFASDHVRGTINVELADSASTYLGWIVSWGTPITLLADTPEEITDMQRQLVRIGIDRPAGRVPGGLDAIGPTAARSRYDVSDYAGLRRAVEERDDIVVLDARLRQEWSTGHLPMSVHIPLHQLEPRISELPDREIWVHCASGYRAAIAASLLDRAGRRVVVVDGEFDTNAPRHFDLARPSTDA